jgi:GH35 family endo-1,4-beta-xylanase
MLASCGPREAARAPASEPEPAKPPVETVSLEQVTAVPLLPRGLQDFGLTHAAISSLETVPVQGQPFDRALRVTLTSRPENPWSAQLCSPVGGAVQEGDVLLARVHVRLVKTLAETGEGRADLVFEKRGEPWTKSVSFPINAGAAFTRIDVPFRVVESYREQGAQLCLQLGHHQQTLEIGGIELLSYGNRVALEQLPRTEVTYDGRALDAPWRKAAAERIDKVRKAELSAVVRDAAGKPLSAASVEIVQTRHAFLFGTAVVAARLNTQAGANAETDKYQKALVELFNGAVLENDLKWGLLAGEWGPHHGLGSSLRAVDWLNQRGMAVRGHVLVWPSWRNSPKFLQRFEKDPKALRAAIQKHIAEAVGATRGKLAHWDVLNEPYDNHDILDILGRQEAVEWFRAARRADPKVKLFINDYAILSGNDSAHRDHYDEFIDFLIRQKAPLDGIGMQGHFGGKPTSPAQMLSILDRYARFGKEIVVTEYDFDTNDEALAADFTRDLMTVLFSHPSVTGFYMWGFWDGQHWKHNAPIFRKDFSMKPSGAAYEKLVLEEWRTKARGKADASGRFTARGFHGDYTVRVEHAGQTKSANVSLGKNGASVILTL